MIKRLMLIVMMALGSMAVANAAFEAYEFEDPAKERTFHDLNKTLRCPKCQNNSIGDSNAELAQDMRQKVYEMLEEDKSESEIVDYMVARYGNFVTYEPPLTFATLILWLAPAMAVAIGIGFIVVRAREDQAKQAAHIDAKEQQRLQALLNENQEDKPQ